MEISWAKIAENLITTACLGSIGAFVYYIRHQLKKNTKDLNIAFGKIRALEKREEDLEW